MPRPILRCAAAQHTISSIRIAGLVAASSLVLTLAGCSGSGSQQPAASGENAVDICTDKGTGPTHPDYEQCLEDTARGRCAQAGAPESAEYGACMQGQHDAAFARDQIRRWGF